MQDMLDTMIHNLSNQKPEHTTGESRRTGVRRIGETRRDQVWRDEDGSIRPTGGFKPNLKPFRVSNGEGLNQTRNPFGFQKGGLNGGV